MSTGNPNKISEEELIRRLQLKDREALVYLYDHYSAALNGVILRILQDTSLTNEVLQDAFLKIWNKMPDYDARRGRLFTWMLNLTKNLAIDKLRSREISKSKKTEGIDNVVYSYERSHHVSQSTDSIGVKDLVSKLRDEEKVIVDLVYFQGYTQSEVSAKTGIPLGTVKTRLRMALKNLRKITGEG